MKRLIIQNIDGVPDEVLASVLIKGLPEKGAARYNTAYGNILVSVVNRRKSRVYTFWKTDSERVLLDAFGELSE